MQGFLGVGSALGFVVAGAAAYLTRSDIQLGIVATGFFAGLILWGQAVLIGRIEMLEAYAYEARQQRTE
jgi:hypothetical protein